MAYQGIQPPKSHVRHTGDMCPLIYHESKDFLPNISPQIAQETYLPYYVLQLYNLVNDNITEALICSITYPYIIGP